MPNQKKIKIIFLSGFLALGMIFACQQNAAFSAEAHGGPSQEEGLYGEAVALYQQQKYSEALLKFFKLREIRPGFKDVEQYIGKIENYLSLREEQRLSEDSVVIRKKLEEDRRKRIEERLSAAQKRQAGAPETREAREPQEPSGDQPKENIALKPEAPQEGPAKEDSDPGNSPEDFGQASPADSKQENLLETQNEKTAESPAVVLKQGQKELSPRQQAELESKQKVKDERLSRKKARLAKAAQGRERNELIAQINKAYREAAAGYKAGLFTESREEILNLTELLARDELPAKFQAKMEQKVSRLDNLLKGRGADRKAHDRYLSGRKERQGETSGVEHSSTEQPQALPDIAAGADPQPKSEVLPAQVKQQEKEQRRLQRIEQKRSRDAVRQAKITAKQKAREEKRAVVEEQKRQKKEARISRIARAQDETIARQEGQRSKFLQQRRKIADWKKEEAQDRTGRSVAELKRRKFAMEDQKEKTRKELLKGVDEIYCDAIVFYAQGVYDRSEQLLREVDKLWPNYKMTRSYLELIGRQKNPGGKSAAGTQQEDRLSLGKEKAVQGALDALEKETQPTAIP